MVSLLYQSVDVSDNVYLGSEIQTFKSNIKYVKKKGINNPNFKSPQKDKHVKSCSIPPLFKKQ